MAKTENIASSGKETQLFHALRRNRGYYLSKLLKIQTKSGDLDNFTPNEQQQFIIDLIWCLNELETPVRLVICKARQIGMCLDPNTKVLTADLKWVRLDDIEPGQEVVSIDENIPGGKGRGRKMRRGIVEAKKEVLSQAFKITMDDGRELIATKEHRFLFRRRGGTEAQWRTVEKAKVGDHIRHITKPWEDSQNYEDGWFGGMIDGEGSLSNAKRAGASLTVSQRFGDVYDRMSSYLSDRGYAFREEIDKRTAGDSSKLGTLEVGKVVIARMNELFRLIGQTRPSRFIDRGWWENRDLPGRGANEAWSRIVSIEPLAEQRMIDLQTSTKTFIAEGFVSHNSTLGAGLLFHATTMWPHRHAKVIAHDTDTTELLFEKSKMFYNQLPDGLFKPQTERSDRKQIVYGEPLHSRLTVSTAGTKTAGSGSTVQYLHCSEVAKWENPGTVMTSLMQAVPKASVNPNTVIIIESTANGQGGYYHEQYKGAKEGKEQLMADLWAARKDKDEMLSILEQFPRTIGWLPIFFPWYEFKEYQEKVVDRDWFRSSLTPEELELKNKYNLTLEQLQFRRTEIENLKKDERGILPEELFKQEYPSNDTEAFLVTGSTFFHQPSLLAQNTTPVVFRGNINDELKGEVGGKIRDLTYDEWKQKHVDEDGRVKLAATEDIYGSLSIWEHPEKGGQYVASVDVSLGERENSDFSVVQVLRKLSDGKVRQVARWRGKVHPEVLAKYAIQIAAYYNEAILGFENNSFGVNCVRVLQNSLYPYPYIRNSRNFKEISDAPTEEWGWNTNVGTKGMVLAEANRKLYEGLLELNDKETISEMQVFKQDGPTKLTAPPGMHDDCVMALAIGLWIVSEHPWSPHYIDGAIPLVDRKAMEESAEMQPEDTWEVEPEYETSFS